VLGNIRVAGGAGMPPNFIFGDSLVDAGNNNYIVSLSKANYPPNGIDFFGHEPTGRYTNGRTIIDILGAMRTQSLCLIFDVMLLVHCNCIALPVDRLLNFSTLSFGCMFQGKRWDWEGSCRRTWPRIPRATP
jgi:hypothetical protein